jgi:DNA-binding transcriptional ArsR family regulator
VTGVGKFQEPGLSHSEIDPIEIGMEPFFNRLKGSHVWAFFETRIDVLRNSRKYLRVMHKSSILDALFPAVRQQILAATLLEPEKWWYLTELAAHLGTSPSTLQRELGALSRSGLLELRQDGRRTYYRANAGSPVFSELRELFGKTAGIIPTLRPVLKTDGTPS